MNVKPFGVENYDDKFIVRCGGEEAIVYDARQGVGATANNADVRHFGFATVLRIDKFLNAAEFLSEVDERGRSLSYLPKVRTSPGWGIPSLYLREIPETVRGVRKARYEVVGHEGRHRSRVARKLGCTKVPVHIFVSNKRSRHMTPEVLEAIRQGVLREGAPTRYPGPFDIVPLDFEIAFVDDKRYDYVRAP